MGICRWEGEKKVKFYVGWPKKKGISRGDGKKKEDF